MALYSGKLGLAEALAAPMTSDRPDGLWPTVVVDEAGTALGLAYSNLDSVAAALETGTGVYQSRSRGLWRKGESSGATQELLGVGLDCDRDTLRFTVRQADPGFCHTGSRSCWGEDAGIARLGRRLAALAADPPSGSNTAKLLDDPELLTTKLTEEAGELAGAVSPEDVVHEVADLIYFALVKATAAGVSTAEIEAELDSRERRISRRPMERTGP
jgi:phosphoribosyl-ATP pyrophosphohydrolase